MLPHTLDAHATQTTGETRSLTLGTGESTTVSYPLGTDLSVSRRGVVDVFGTNDGQWHSTGLDGGCVIIDGRDDTSGEPRLPRLFVTVRPTGENAKSAETFAPPTLPAWLCSPRGIVCDHAAGLVKGKTGSLPWYFHARATCAAAPACFFAVTLAATAQHVWSTRLATSLGASYHVQVGARAPAVIWTACGKNGRKSRVDDVDAVTGRQLSAGLLALRCLEDAPGPRYRLGARAFLVEDSTARQLGFASSATLVLAASPITREAGLLTRLKALAATNQAEIIGQPVVRLGPGQEVELLSGGEFAVVDYEPGDGHHTSWKQHGLSLHVTAVPLDKTHARITYEAALKTRQGADQEALAVNSLRSEIDITLGTPTMVGVLDMRSHGQDSHATPVLAQLPILGPLFAATSHQESSSRLFLWLELDRDEAQGVLDGPRPGAATGTKAAATAQSPDYTQKRRFNP